MVVSTFERQETFPSFHSTDSSKQNKFILFTEKATSGLAGVRACPPSWSNSNLERWVLRRKENRRTRERPLEHCDNQQQHTAQPTYGTGPESNQATVVPPHKKKNISIQPKR